MSSEIVSVRNQIIDDLEQVIREKLPADQASQIVMFARYFYSCVAPNDLLTKKQEDLYGITLSMWQLLKKRKPGQAKVRVYNPHQEQHGWQSTHTIVEVNTEDSPFLVDSLRMAATNCGYGVHLIIHMGKLMVQRNNEGELEACCCEKNGGNNILCESTIYIEIDRQTAPEALEALQSTLLSVLEDVRVAVMDWQSMRKCVDKVIQELEGSTYHIDSEQVSESIAFLEWLQADHFTFLGACEYELSGKGDDRCLKAIKGTELGLLREGRSLSCINQSEVLTPETKALLGSQQILIISKNEFRSTVHRPVYTENICVKRFNDAGEIIGEVRVVGLYTSVAYNCNPKKIPFLRRKVATVIERSGLEASGHAGKALLNILETMPRDDLFQATADELFDISIGILHLQERRRIRLFARQDVFGRFISCLVYIPREQFNTELREDVEEVLRESFNAVEISFAPHFSDSVLARIQFFLRIDTSKPLNYDINTIERRLAEIARTWRDDLLDAMLDHFGEEKGNALYSEYRKAFPASYRDDFLPRTATYDIEHIEAICDKAKLGMSFYRPLQSTIKGLLRFKLFHSESTIPLSDVLPMLENMGLRVIGERPYQITTASNKICWINDFGMAHAQGEQLEVEYVKETFHEAFSRVWLGEMENDGFNQLVLSAGMNWREITVFRAYAKYLKQIGFTFSQAYIEETVAKHPEIAQQLMAYFIARFEPNEVISDIDCQIIQDKILDALENVAVLDEDRILRRYLDLINATLRTNFFQNASDGQGKSYISFKFSVAKIPEVPLPLPKFEIFVYSPNFEGVHLRSAKVARGGLRWSDRREDFRTEILGLMKAQSVKNSIIVPAGAKGGFVCKNLPETGTREEIMNEVVACYQNFIRGLLDIIDNFINGEIIPPKQVRCFDGTDYYLVVAADKGTATFSDIANEIAKSYGFWLGDAFASGGSAGYDHKKMGITARGAWVSVQRHFREMGINTQTTDFTVIGIGDMAGDVFGNGMLLSKHIKLVAAFNHMHIFIDPNPDPAKSFEERKRLFELPRSSWEDYNADLISAGGGIFRRTAKSIRLTPEMKTLFGVNNDIVVPNELIKTILRAPVDLIWNGGIGTYVKASEETDADVGDRTNDALRVNGNELCCRVFCEGGNLGLTQLGRVEFALNGGLVNTDFIDNAAGVDCSDHEVNLKILLDDVVRSGDMTEKQRNTLLSEMTDEVADLVLDNNVQQTLSLSISFRRAPKYVELHSRYIHELERVKKLNRKLEYLPNYKLLLERKSKGLGLTRPEIAVLLAYTKNILQESIISSEVPEDAELMCAVETAFPKVIRQKYKDKIYEHSLKREIIATQLSNSVVNEMGITFVHRLHDETGAPLSVIVRAYYIVRSLLEIPRRWQEIQSLNYQVHAEVQYDLSINILRLARRYTRWFLRNRRVQLNVRETIDEFNDGLQILIKEIPALLRGEEQEHIERKVQEYIEQGVPVEIATEVTNATTLYSALDIIQASKRFDIEIKRVAELYFVVGSTLELNWFREMLTVQAVESRWDALMREALRDDLDWQQRDLSIAIMYHYIKTDDPRKKIEKWMESHSGLIDRWMRMLEDLRSRSVHNFNMYSVAVRELLDLAQTSIHSPHVTKNIPTESGGDETEEDKTKEKASAQARAQTKRSKGKAAARKRKADAELVQSLPQSRIGDGRDAHT